MKKTLNLNVNNKDIVVKLQDSMFNGYYYIEYFEVLPNRKWYQTKKRLLTSAMLSYDEISISLIIKMIREQLPTIENRKKNIENFEKELKNY